MKGGKISFELTKTDRPDTQNPEYRKLIADDVKNKDFVTIYRSVYNQNYMYVPKIKYSNSIYYTRNVTEFTDTQIEIYNILEILMKSALQFNGHTLLVNDISVINYGGDGVVIKIPISDGSIIIGKVLKNISTKKVIISNEIRIITNIYTGNTEIMPHALMKCYGYINLENYDKDKQNGWFTSFSDSMTSSEILISDSVVEKVRDSTKNNNVTISFYEYLIEPTIINETVQNKCNFMLDVKRLFDFFEKKNLVYTDFHANQIMKRENGQHVIIDYGNVLSYDNYKKNASIDDINRYLNYPQCDSALSTMQAGGINYYDKYLKYKNKYNQLKQSK